MGYQTVSIPGSELKNKSLWYQEIESKLSPSMPTRFDWLPMAITPDKIYDESAGKFGRQSSIVAPRSTRCLLRCSTSHAFKERWMVPKGAGCIETAVGKGMIGSMLCFRLEMAVVWQSARLPTQCRQQIQEQRNLLWIPVLSPNFACCKHLRLESCSSAERSLISKCRSSNRIATLRLDDWVYESQECTQQTERMYSWKATCKLRPRGNYLLNQWRRAKDSLRRYTDFSLRDVRDKAICLDW